MHMCRKGVIYIRLTDPVCVFVVCTYCAYASCEPRNFIARGVLALFGELNLANPFSYHGPWDLLPAQWPKGIGQSGVIY